MRQQLSKEKHFYGKNLRLSKPDEDYYSNGTKKTFTITGVYDVNELSAFSDLKKEDVTGIDKKELKALQLIIIFLNLDFIFQEKTEKSLHMTFVQENLMQEIICPIQLCTQWSICLQHV